MQADEDNVQRASGMGNSWWSHEQHSCRQAGKRTTSCPSPVDYWIPGEAVQNGPIEPLYHAIRMRMQSCCPGFVDGEYFTVSCKLQNRSFSLDPSAVVEEPRIVRSSVELEPLQRLRPLVRE
ncbi:hypothetical protein TNCV_3126671 [Trichonephila clavipes]|nr:hypothetical protein TNCV_3126671 [Trichonephila clavipes]